MSLSPKVYPEDFGPGVLLCEPVAVGLTIRLLLPIPGFSGCGFSSIIISDLVSSSFFLLQSNSCRESVTTLTGRKLRYLGFKEEMKRKSGSYTAFQVQFCKSYLFAPQESCLTSNLVPVLKSDRLTSCHF